MNLKIKRMVISYARRLSMSWPPRVQAKAACKVDAALHRCSKCGVLCYEGSSDKNYEALLQKYPNDTILFSGIQMDHISPVIDIQNGWTSWDDFFNGLFCSVENFRGLCPKCHDSKTLAESKLRPGSRPKKKRWK